MSLLRPLQNPTITEAQREFFEKKIRPVLAEQCLDCHNSINEKSGGLALDWSQPLRREGLGKLIIPGDPDKSLLIQFFIRHQPGVESMPSEAPSWSTASSLISQSGYAWGLRIHVTHSPRPRV